MPGLNGELPNSAWPVLASIERELGGLRSDQRHIAWRIGSLADQVTARLDGMDRRIDELHRHKPRDWIASVPWLHIGGMALLTLFGLAGILSPAEVKAAAKAILGIG